MKTLLVVIVVSTLVVVAWRAMRDTEVESGGMDRLSASIDRSALPERAKAEMRRLLDQGRLRPSQYLTAATSAGDR
jgi:hypothetical protein